MVVVDGEFIAAIEIVKHEIQLQSLKLKYSIEIKHFGKLVIFPGIIDLNVKFNPYIDNLTKLTQAAICGGITFILIDDSVHQWIKE